MKLSRSDDVLREIFPIFAKRSSGRARAAGATSGCRPDCACCRRVQCRPARRRAAPGRGNRRRRTRIRAAVASGGVAGSDRRRALVRTRHTGRFHCLEFFPVRIGFDGGRERRLHAGRDRLLAPAAARLGAATGLRWRSASRRLRQPDDWRFCAGHRPAAACAGVIESEDATCSSIALA